MASFGTLCFRHHRVRRPRLRRQLTSHLSTRHCQVISCRHVVWTCLRPVRPSSLARPRLRPPTPRGNRPPGCANRCPAVTVSEREGQPMARNIRPQIRLPERGSDPKPWEVKPRVKRGSHGVNGANAIGSASRPMCCGYFRSRANPGPSGFIAAPLFMAVGAILGGPGYAKPAFR